jgi:hypothetical protein
MGATERSLWVKFRDEMVPRVGGRWERVENGVVIGMPDTNYCVRGVEGWIELKEARMGLPGSRTKKQGVFEYNRGLSIEQVNWLLKQESAGGRGFILARVQDTSYLWHGRDAAGFNGANIEELGARAAWYGKSFDCPRLRMQLLEREEAYW